jgi:nucleoside-diphosphate-sugar epimerase
MIKSNLLLSGCNGFVGRNLLSSNYFKDYNLFCLVRNANQADELKKIRNNIRLILIDEMHLKDKEIVFEACIHLAAYGVNPKQDSYVEYINSNILLTLKLYEFARNNGCKIFINIGSVFEYGVKYSNSIISEINVPSPDNMYGASKYSAHILLSAFQKRIGLKFITVRPFGLFGKYEQNTRLYPQVIISGLKNQMLKLTSGNQMRNIVYVMDFVKFLNLLIENKDSINVDVINFTNSIPISIKEFTEIIIEKLRFDKTLFQFGMLPYRKNESMSYIGDNKLLNSVIKNFEFTDLEIAINQSFGYYK